MKNKKSKEEDFNADLEEQQEESTTADEEQEIDIPEEKHENHSSAKKMNKNLNYRSFERRIALYFLLILLFLILSVVFLTKSFSAKSGEQINYKELSHVDYKVYLKKNDFYETEYLNKDMAYVASLIKNIEVDFNYIFNITKDSSLDFDYDVIGRLIITDNNGQKVFYQKDYTLLKKEYEKMTDNTTHEVSKKIDIDYGYYNNLANNFRSSYGINTKSNLIVIMNVHKKNAENSNFNIDSNGRMSLTIPLSEKAIDIKMNYKEINKDSQIFTDMSVVVNNYVYMVLSVISIIGMIAFIIPLTKLIIHSRTKKSPYDKQVNKILKEYDRLIVETTTPPNTSDESYLTKVKNFDELLDVRDNLGLPIKYYVITKHEKCNFYINHGNEVYLLIVKSADFEKPKKRKK